MLLLTVSYLWGLSRVPMTFPLRFLSGYKKCAQGILPNFKTMTRVLHFLGSFGWNKMDQEWRHGSHGGAFFPSRFRRSCSCVHLSLYQALTPKPRFPRTETWSWACLPRVRLLVASQDFLRAALQSEVVLSSTPPSHRPLLESDRHCGPKPLPDYSWLQSSIHYGCPSIFLWHI